jgi:hypothetical protein
MCGDLKKQPIIVRGSTIFPNETGTQNHLFTLSVDDIRKRRNGTADSVMIKGCIDYVSESGERHHQTRFIYELDSPIPGRPFAPIKFDNGDIAPSNLTLAVNPMLGIDAD